MPILTHPQVRITDAGFKNARLYRVELFDGEAWEATSAPLPEKQAHVRADWLSRALRLAEKNGEKP